MELIRELDQSMLVPTTANNNNNNYENLNIRRKQIYIYICYDKSVTCHEDRFILL